MLQYEPRNVSPQGKQNIYFTCHPDDLNIYFNRIFDDIRNISNCIVWYNTEENYNNDDIKLLEKMSLFVVPITTKLLTQPCRTMKIDIPYAQNATTRKPILPLMQESSLDELFYKNFKDLQYLDSNLREETAISYEEKLKKFLDSILIGDELASKIRTAFDAYIFLSYRKKDRKYANELMRLIHKNDFCRDIAIWYDEYLVPGEDFNHAIEDALKKSDLFTMVVTPNLINEANYVKNYEYPNATIQEKKILPVEMVQTDLDELAKQYPSIPNSVDGQDSTALSNALKESFEKNSHTENDTAPLHNFFIGLAYLNGIDVEINNERALNLIISAAEAKEKKVPEAIEKLVSMYKLGQGVKRDYNKAIDWQKKLVNYWQNKYKKSRKIKDHKKLFFSLQYLGEQLCNMENFVDAENVFKKMLKLCKNNPNNKTNLFITYYNLGNLFFQKGEWDVARKNFQKITELYENGRKKKSVENMRNLAIAYGRLSEVNIELGYLENAQNYNKKCIFYNELLFNKKIEVRYNLTLSYKRQGNILSTLGDSFEARKFYNKSCALLEQLIEENINIDYFRLLANIYAMIGDLYIQQESLINAQEFYKKSIEIYIQINEQTESISSQSDLAASYSRYGDLFFLQDNLYLAELYFQKSLSIFKQLVIKTKTLKYKINLSKCYEKIGNIFFKQGNFYEAEKSYQKCQDLCKPSADKNKDAKRELSISYGLLGVLYKKKGYLEKAKLFYNQCSILFNQLAENSQSIEAYKDLLILYTQLMELFSSFDDIEEVENIYQKSLDCSKKYLGKSKVWETKYYMSSCYIQIGDLRFDYGWGDFHETEKMYKKSLELREQLNEENCSVKIQNGLIIIYSRFAELFTAQNEYDKALSYYNKSIVLCKNLIKETGDYYEAKIKLSFIYLRIGSLCLKKDYTKQANIFYLKSIEICEQISKEIESVDVKRCLSMTYSKLGNLRKKNHEFKEAEKMYLKSLFLIENNYNDTEGTELLRELSSIYRKLGEVYFIQKNTIEAEKFCKKNVTLCQQSVNKSKTISNIYDLIISYERFADLRDLQGDKKDAEKMYYKGMALCEQLLERKASIDIYEQLGIFFIKIAFLRKPYNLFFLEKALQIYVPLAKEYPENKKYVKTLSMIIYELNIRN